MSNENIELAKEHVKLAEDLVMNETKNANTDEELNEIREAKFALEKAEAEIEDLEKNGEEKTKQSS